MRRVVLCNEFVRMSAQPQHEEMAMLIKRFVAQFRSGAPFQMTPIEGVRPYHAIQLEGSSYYVLLSQEDDRFVLLAAGTLTMIHRFASVYCCEFNARIGQYQLYQDEGAKPEDVLALNTPLGIEPTPVATAVPRVDWRGIDAPEGVDTLSVKAQDATLVKTPSPVALSAILEDLTDDDLLSIGLPERLLSLVRSLQSADDLARREKQLPASVYEALTWLTQGESWASVRQAYALCLADLKESGQRIQSDAFIEVTSDDELMQILDRPLDEWRVFLHPMQRALVHRPWYGAVRVTGGAGTGKTVVALHRALHLVRLADWQPTERLLFTTFTKNLAIDLESQLRSMATREEMRRIEVIHIDAWLATFLRQHGAHKRLCYPYQKPYEEAWQAALLSRAGSLTYDKAFYRTEWEEVILPQGIQSSKEYMFASRLGRGQALSRAERKAIWPLFEEMRLQLDNRNLITVEDAAQFATVTLTQQTTGHLYRAVVADEIQDFKPCMLTLLRALASEADAKRQREGDLFMVGDPHQRIYGRMAAFSASGIHIRGRSRILRTNYRTTDEIRKTAESIYDRFVVDDMEGHAAPKVGYLSVRHGQVPQVHQADSLDDEVKWIAQEIERLTDENRAKENKVVYNANEICIVLRRNEDVQRYAELLAAQNIAVKRISRNQSDNRADDGVRLATMHRVKGLEFKVVFIASMNDGIFPATSSSWMDPSLQQQRWRQEMALFYVASSRACQRLYYSAWGQPSVFMPAVTTPA